MDDVVRANLVWDNHACMPLRADATFLPQLERFRRAGVDVVSLNVGMADIPLIDHLRVISYMRYWIGQRPELYTLVSTAADVRECKAKKQLGIVFDVEGMVPVQDQLSFVRTFYELGVRWMLIAYNRQNRAGGGCLDTDAGLTETGRTIIDEMERVGMVLCLSHTGARTAAEALEYSKNPAIFSHSNPSADSPHARNIPDSLMLACARKGGVIGLSGIGPFLGTAENLVERLLRQLRYAIDLVGARHVGLGLDYVFDQEELKELVRANPSSFPAGLTSDGTMMLVGPESMGEIAEGLAKDNLSESDIRGVLGENWLRIADQVWR